MEHLIELRSRLIKALGGVLRHLSVLFLLAGDIYNILIWPFEWIAGAENTALHLHGAARILWTKVKLAMFGAASSRSRSSQRRSTSSWHPAPIATSACLRAPIWWRRRSSSRSARRWSNVMVHADDRALFARMQQLGGPGQARSSFFPKSANIST